MNYLLFISIILIIIACSNMKHIENYAPLYNYSKELQQLFKDYYLYTYKNNNFGKITDKEGDFKNPPYNTHIQDTQDWKRTNRKFFKFTQLLNPVANQAKNRFLNNNVSLLPYPVKHSNENADMISSVGYKLDPKFKHTQYDNNHYTDDKKKLYTKNQTLLNETSLNGGTLVL